MSDPPLLFDLAGRGSVALSGKDRASFLHGLVTNDVKRMTPGQGCAAAFLTPKGKLLAECVVLCEEERLVLDTPPELAATVETLLRKYLVFNDVTIANETEETHVFHVAGDAAGNVVEDSLRRSIGHGEATRLPGNLHASVAAQFTFEENPPGAAAGGAVRIVRENRTGIEGCDLRVPSSLSTEISSSLLSAGARLESAERLDSLRIAAGIPRWGAELTEAVLPDEAGLRERGFISENKGCYVGQEIVARIKTYGHVNRRLVRLSVSGGLPVPGDAVFFESEKAGTLTSVAVAAGGGVALAFVRRERAEPGTAFTVVSARGPLEASVV
jgi:folate-binding protein YgfZ